MVIDFHTHTLLSDGVLLISELIRRAEVNRYRAIGITDHVDFSNMERVAQETLKACFRINQWNGVVAIPGIEITHVPPAEIPDLVSRGRKLGIKLIVVHGETLAEPVPPGTNRQAILSGAEILAHPGLISEEDLRLAKENGTFLEISFRRGHCLTNGYVAMKARKYGVPLLVNSDAHGPEELLTPAAWRDVAKGAGLEEEDWRQVLKASFHLARKIGFELEEANGT